ncbi:MAG: hypothetical protein QM757_33370 [Paludibaculum sp.]
MKLIGFEPEPIEAAKLEANGTLDYCLNLALGGVTARRFIHHKLARLQFAAGTNPGKHSVHQ